MRLRNFDGVGTIWMKFSIRRPLESTLKMPKLAQTCLKTANINEKNLTFYNTL